MAILMSFRLGWRDALLNSVSGIRFLISERAFRQELYVGLVLIAVELFRSSSVFMLLYIFASYFLVLLMEAVNSAIETTIDRIGLERHPLSKKAKDIGSAAVLISIIHLCIAWMTSFFL